MTEHVRVLVIGGGAMGVSALYHLAKLGWRDVALVEKNELTAGSTWHAAGLCTHFAHNLTIQAMRAHSVRLYGGELEKETGRPVSFHQTGALRITRSPDRMDEFRHVRGIGKFSDFEFNILTPDELKEIYPLVELEGLIGAIHEPLDGHVDPAQATHAMAEGARSFGARIFRNTRVTGIAQSSDQAWRVGTDKNDFVAEHIVMAAGTWAHEIGRMAGLDLPVVPVLHQYLVTDRIAAVAELDDELPIIRDPEESWYVRQERDGMIIGPYERDGKIWSTDSVPAEFGMELLPPDLDAVTHIVEMAMARLPVLHDAGIKTVVNGPITFTPDANPLIGPAFGSDNCWLLTGSSMGVMEGGGAGKFLAEWIVGGEPPMDALAVDPRRFGAFADRDYRIAKAVESFGNQFAVHYPFEEREAGRPRLKSSLHDAMEAQGAVFGQAYGWERPNWFTGAQGGRNAALTFRRPAWFDQVAGECEAASQRVTVADLSAFAKFEVAGPGAERFMEELGANTPPRAAGRVGLVHALTLSGGIASEFAVIKRDDGSYHLTSAAGARRHDAELLRQHAANYDGVTIRDQTQEMGILAVMGPRAENVLGAVSSTDLSIRSFPWLTAQTLEVAGKLVFAVRVSYIGEAGWELHAAMSDLPAIYSAVMEAGAAQDIGHFGAFAMNAMRLEKGYPAWGLDLSTERTPLEANLARFVKTENRRFCGRDGLLAREAQYRLELLEASCGPYDPFGLHPVFAGERVSGLVTSGAWGHRVGKALALVYVHVDAPRGDFSIEICGVRLAAQVLKTAPYDPENLRLVAG